MGPSAAQVLERPLEMRHYLSPAREHGESDLAKRITDANHFYVRLKLGPIFFARSR